MMRISMMIWTTRLMQRRCYLKRNGSRPPPPPLLLLNVEVRTFLIRSINVIKAVWNLEITNWLIIWNFFNKNSKKNTKQKIRRGFQNMLNVFAAVLIWKWTYVTIQLSGNYYRRECKQISLALLFFSGVFMLLFFVVVVLSPVWTIGRSKRPVPASVRVRLAVGLIRIITLKTQSCPKWIWWSLGYPIVVFRLSNPILKQAWGYPTQPRFVVSIIGVYSFYLLSHLAHDGRDFCIVQTSTLNDLFLLLNLSFGRSASVHSRQRKIWEFMIIDELGLDLGGLPDVTQAKAFRVLRKVRWYILPTTDQMFDFDKKGLQSGNAGRDDDQI